MSKLQPHDSKSKAYIFFFASINALSVHYLVLMHLVTV